MILLHAIRWHFLATLRLPLSWVLLVVVALAWPTMSSLMGLGLNTVNLLPSAALWQLGLVGMLVGCTIALYRLCKGGWWTQRTAPGSRLAIETGSIATLGLAFFLSATLAGLWTVDLRELVRAFGGASVACLHAALLGGLILATTEAWPAPLRAGLLPFLGWLVPGALRGDSFIERGIRQTLDLARYFEFPLGVDSSALFWPSSLCTLLGLFGLRWAVLSYRAPQTCDTQSSATSTPT